MSAKWKRRCYKSSRKFSEYDGHREMLTLVCQSSNSQIQLRSSGILHYTGPSITPYGDSARLSDVAAGGLLRGCQFVRRRTIEGWR
jgi:hypothetical protein